MLVYVAIADIFVSDVKTPKNTFLGCTKKVSNFPFIISSGISKALQNTIWAIPYVLAAIPQSKITSLIVYPPISSFKLKSIIHWFKVKD